MNYFKTLLITAFFSFPFLISAQPAEKIVFVEELKEQAREQLRRIVSDYDLNDWMFTNQIKVVHGEDARSYPILTMNTNHLEDDKVQLSVFVHENAHWYVADDEKDVAENAAIEELKQLYPNPPEPKQKNLYHHIMVVWVEWDALLEIFGEEEAQSIMERKINYYIRGNPESKLSQNYRWYNDIAMNDAEEVGKIMVKHGFNINPQKGIVIE